MESNKSLVYNTLRTARISGSSVSGFVNGAAYRLRAPAIDKTCNPPILGNQAIRLGDMLPPSLMLLSAPGMACGNHYSCVDAHDCRPHRRIPPQSGTVPPPS